MAGGKIRKRSVTLAGHRTSLSVEDEFWTYLKAIAEERGIAVAELLVEVDTARGGNLSSAVRLYVLAWLAAQAGMTSSKEIALPSSDSSA